MKLGYVRVSTADQNEARQIEALKPYGIEKWYCEKVSGKDMNRGKLQEMLSFAREGDTVYVEDFSRLARSTQDLLKITDDLKNRGIHLVSLKENLDTGTPTGKLMLTVIAAIAEFERENILERQREGIEIAKREGKYKGRAKKKLPKDFESVYDSWMRHKISKSGIAKEYHVSRPIVYRWFEEYERKQKQAES